MQAVLAVCSPGDEVILIASYSQPSRSLSE
jgi:hypothetical protein